MGNKEDTTGLLPPQYLGDGVYIHDEGFRIVLAVNHHDNKVVYMEKSEIENFIEYVNRSGILK